MNQREQLIERIRAVRDDGYLSATYLGDEHLGDLMGDILTVFEEAHAPTDHHVDHHVDHHDDERGRFADHSERYVPKRPKEPQGGCDTRGKDVADMVLALGLHRTVQGDAVDDVRRAVRMWADRFIPGDRWDTEDARDLEAALSCIVESSPTAHDRRRTVQGEPDEAIAARMNYDLAVVLEEQRNDARATLSRVRAEAEELNRQGYPVGMLLRILAEVMPEYPQGEPPNVTEPGVTDISPAQMSVQGEPTPGKRLDPDFRADLVGYAKARIQDVWADVPEGVDAETLAQNVVAAQEFLWIARGFPVASAQGEPSLRDHVRNLTGASDAELSALGGFTGEPSDAAVKAALDEYLRGETAGKVRAMRAALRAAAEQ